MHSATAVSKVSAGTPRIRFASIAASAFALYFFLGAIQYDTNGIVEAQSVEAGNVVHHNHLLYRPLGLAAYKFAQQAGYVGPSHRILQILNAFYGALAVGFSYVAFTRVTKHRLSSAGGTVWLATSFSFWYCSTDAMYLTLAACFSSAALVCALNVPDSKRSIAAGLLVAGAILTWQASIFFLPAVIFFIAREQLPLKRKISYSVIAVAACGAAVLTTYVAVGAGIYEKKTVSALASWITSYENPTLSIWGRWDTDRLPRAAESAARSLVPISLMAGPVELRKENIQFGRVAVDIAVLAEIVLICGGLIFCLRRHSPLRRASAGFALGYAAFLPFIVWWDPFEPLWFVIPNLMLAGFLATSWASQLNRALPIFIFVSSISAIAFTNLVTVVFPRHAELGPERETAECVAAQMKPSDLFLAAEWGWPDYLPYLHQRRSLNLLNASAQFNNTVNLLRFARAAVAETHASGGRAFTTEPASYKGSTLEWLEFTTSLRRQDLETFGGKAAFRCADKTFRVLQSGNG